MNTLPPIRAYMTRFSIRNGLALAGLLLAVYLPDVRAIEFRSGWDKVTPYLFVLLLYGWLAFHNRILFERLFERGKTREYFFWTALFVVSSSLNITLILHYVYNQAWVVPVLFKFYVFSLTGFGVYMAYRQLGAPRYVESSWSAQLSQPLSLIVDGGKCEIDPDRILYIESLQNYVRIFTSKEQLISRKTMKQLASELPGYFLRINRSCLVNLHYVEALDGNELLLGGLKLRVGRTYKQHVNAHFEPCSGRNNVKSGNA